MTIFRGYIGIKGDFTLYIQIKDLSPTFYDKLELIL